MDPAELAKALSHLTPAEREASLRRLARALPESDWRRFLERHAALLARGAAPAFLQLGHLEPHGSEVRAAAKALARITQTPWLQPIGDLAPAEDDAIRAAFAPGAGPIVDLVVDASEQLWVATKTSVHEWNPRTGATRPVLALARGEYLRLAVGAGRLVVRVAHARTSQQAVTYGLDEGGGPLKELDLGNGAATLSPDARRVADLGDANAAVYDTGTGECVWFPLWSTPSLDAMARVVFKLDRIEDDPDQKEHVESLQTWLSEQYAAKRYVSHAVFSPDGQRLLVSDTNGGLVSCDLATRQATQLPWRAGVLLALHPDGRHAAFRRDDGWALIDLESGRSVREAGAAGPTSALAFDRPGRFAVTLGAGDVVRAWDVETMRELGAATAERTKVIAISSGGVVFTGGADGVVRGWDLRRSRPRAVRKALAPVWATAALGDLGAVTRSDDTLELIDLTTGKVTRTLRGAGSPPSALAFVSNDRLVSIASDGFAPVLWDLSRARSTRMSDARTPSWLAVDTARGRIVVASRDGWLAIHRSDANPPEFVGVGVGPVASLALHPDGRRAIVGLQSSAPVLFDLETRKALQRYVIGLCGRGATLAIHPDGKRFFAAHTGAIDVKDVDSGRALGKLSGHLGTVRSLSLSPDGAHLASAGADRALRLWDTASMREIACWHGDSEITSCAFSTGGVVLAGDADGQVRVARLVIPPPA